MKKLYSTIMMLAMMVAALSSLTACGGSDDEGGGDGDGGSSGEFTITIDGNSRQHSQVILDPQWSSRGNYLWFNLPSMVSVIRFIYSEPITPSTYFTVGYSDFQYDTKRIEIGSVPTHKLTYESGSAVVTKNDGKYLTVKFSKFKFTWGTDRDIVLDGELSFDLSK